MSYAVYDPHAFCHRPLDSFVERSRVGAYSLLEGKGLFVLHHATGRSLRLSEIPQDLHDSWKHFKPTLIESVKLSVERYKISENLDGLSDFSNNLNEGLDDQNILKACFIAGSGGSGKSAITDGMFAGLGMKVINQDIHLERFLAAAKIPLKDVGIHYAIQKKAQRLKNSELRQYALSRLGLLIDSTGWDYDRIAEPLKKLRKLGYDCYMVFVSTDLETALARNKARGAAGGREVPDSFIETAWKGAHANLIKYRKLFGAKNLFVIDNDADIPEQTWKSVVVPKLRKLANKILTRELVNPRGIRWIEMQRDPATATIDDPERNKEWKKEPEPATFLTTFAHAGAAAKPYLGGKDIPSSFELEKAAPPEDDGPGSTDMNWSWLDDFLASKLKAKGKTNESKVVVPRAGTPSEAGFVHHAERVEDVLENFACRVEKTALSRAMQQWLITTVDIAENVEHSVGFTWDSKEGVKTLTGKVLIGGKDRWQVTIANQPFARLIAPEELEAEIARDTKNLAFWRANDAKAQTVKDQQKAKEDTHGFADSMSPHAKTKVILTLSKQRSINGEFLTHKAFIEKIAKEGGWTLATSNGKRRLVSPKDSFFYETDLSKTALDYFAYLSKHPFKESCDDLEHFDEWLAYHYPELVNESIDIVSINCVAESARALWRHKERNRGE